jgi:hypothetical protein
MAIIDFGSKVGSFTSMFQIYINAIQTGQAWPDYINDAKRIAGEVAPYLDQYPALKSLVQSFNTTVEKYAPAYANLGAYQRPSETSSNGVISNNIYQQAIDSGKTPEQIAKEGLEARMAGKTYTPATNPFLDYANTLKSQGYTNDQIVKALEQKGATGQQITSTLTDIGAKMLKAAGTTATTPAPIGINHPSNGTTSATGTNAPVSANTGATGTSGTNSATVNANKQAALEYIKNNTSLDGYSKALFSKMVENADPNTPYDFANIEREFNKIKQETIDPVFQEKINIYTDQVKRAREYSAGERQRQLEVEGINAKQNIEGAQANLEARGMTFSGEAEKQLGAMAAYGSQQSGAIPARFGGMEGLVNTGNRLTASSSAAQYQKGLTDLQRQAEQTLGSAKSQGLVPGVNQMGNITGEIPQAKQATERNYASSLYSTEMQRQQENNPIDVFNT